MWMKKNTPWGFHMHYNNGKYFRRYAKEIFKASHELNCITWILNLDLV